MATGKFESLVDMFNTATDSYGGNSLFGIKRDGAYRWTSFAEVRKRTDNFRAGLAKLGVGKGDFVAMVSNNSVEWAVAAYATYGLGAIYVPTYEASKPEHWKYILEDSGAKVLIVASPSIGQKVTGFPGEIETLQQVIVVGGEGEGSFTAVEKLGSENPSDCVMPGKDDLAGLIYTSGTTGEPKGVMLSHGNIISNVNAVHQIFPMTEDDRSVSFLPWAHSFGQTCELHCLLSRGASMGLAEKVPETLVENMGELRPTLLFSVPRIFNKIYGKVQGGMATKPALVQKLFAAGMRLASAKRERSLGLLEGLTLSLADAIVFSKVRKLFGGRMRYAFSGGAAISKEVAQFIDNLGIKVYEGYGLSETSPIATANCPGGHKIGSVGKAIPEVRIEIDTSVVDQEGDEGEIVIHGPNIMRGYYNKEDKTKEVIREDGGFRTGDIGRVDAEGFVFITGRLKEQYKLENGKYVVPAPLEEKLKLSPLIEHCMVYGMNKPFNVALICPEPKGLMAWASENGISGDYEGLMKNPKVLERFKKELDEYSASYKGYEKCRQFALLSEVFSIESDMLTPTMKLKRRIVLKKYQGVIDALYEG